MRLFPLFNILASVVALVTVLGAGEVWAEDRVADDFARLNNCAKKLGPLNYTDAECKSAGDIYPDPKQKGNAILGCQIDKAYAAANELKKKAYDKCSSKVYGSSADDDTDEKTCKDANKEMNDEIKDFKTNCFNANMGGSVDKCFQQIKLCSTCDPGKKRVPRQCKQRGGKVVDITRAIGNFNFGGETVGPNIDESHRRFQYCPARAGEYIKDAREDVEKYTKSTEDLRKQLSDLETELADIQSELEQAQADAQGQIDEAEADINQKITDTKLAEQKNQRDSAAQVQSFLLEIQKLKAQINSAPRRLNAAKIEFNEQLFIMRKNCNNSALKKVNEMQNQKRELIQRSMYTSGGFSSLLESVGLTNQDRMKAVHEKYYRRCKANRNFRLDANLLRSKFRGTSKSIDAEVEINKVQILELQKQITVIKNQELQNMRNILEDLQTYQQNANKKIYRIQEALVRKQSDLNRKYSTAQKNYAAAQQQMQREQNFLRQRQAYAAMAEKYSGGFEVDKGTTSDAIEHGTAAIDKAAEVADSCGCCVGATVLNASACRSSMDYITTYYEKEKDLPIMECFKGVKGSSFKKGQEVKSK